MDKDGAEIDDPRKVCPYCESDTELTEAGIQAEKESAERTARWAKEAAEDDEELVDEAELEEALEELKAEFETLTTEDDGSLQESYPEDTYTIRIWGRTREIGVHKIKKAQYEHWSSEEHEDDLSDALNENYDYEENKTPKAAQFDLPYYEYQGKHSFWGFDQDDTHMTIENSEGETIYDGDIESFFSDAHGEEDSRWETSEEQEELYPEHLGKGYWLMWTQGGKGSCIQTTIEGVFEPKKLKVFNWDIQGTSVVTRLVYDGAELDDEGMDGEHDNWRGQWAQFDVYHNEK
jgi:glutaredoxin